MEITVVDGAFDGLSEDEVEELMDELQQIFDSGDIESIGEPIDMDKLLEEDPELYALIQNQMSKIDPPTLH